MDTISELKRDISMGLQADLDKRFLPGENTVISLPGSLGEALIVTDKRVIVLRDRTFGHDSVSDVFAYPLDKVTGAMAISSGAGGYIELRLAEPVTNPDAARVYFPAHEETWFKSAAEYLSKPQPAREQPVVVSVSQSGDTTCTRCGSSVSEHDAFCPGCGVPLRTICLACGTSSPISSKYCVHCGRDMIEFVADCAKCNSRLLRWMQFCPECGSNQRPVCIGCGTQVMPDWKHCASCGRLLGSDRLDCRASGTAQKRIQQMKDAESQPDRVPEYDADPIPFASPTSAEGHNQRGRELFESENYRGSIAEFEAACASDPDNAGYHCNLAVAYDECDRDAEALAEYQKTLQLNPKDLTALLYLGYMYSEDEQFDKAQETWGKILSIAPDSAEAQEVQQNLRHQGEL